MFRTKVTVATFRSKVAVTTFRSKVAVTTFCSKVLVSASVSNLPFFYVVIQQRISTIIHDFEQASLFDENIVYSLLFRLGYLRHAVLTSFDLRDECCPS